MADLTGQSNKDEKVMAYPKDLWAENVQLRKENEQVLAHSAEVRIEIAQLRTQLAKAEAKVEKMQALIRTLPRQQNYSELIIEEALK